MLLLLVIEHVLIPPSLYLSVGHEYLNSGKMIIGGSNDISGIGALLIASEPLSQQYANQWMLLEPDEMVSASFIKRIGGRDDSVKSRYNKMNNNNDDEDIATDIILMRKCLSTACQKRKSRMHGRGVWASNDYWMTTPIIVLATLFLFYLRLVFLSFQVSQIYMCTYYFMVKTKK